MLLKTKSYEVLFGTGFASKGFAGFANPMLPPIASYSQTNADRKTKTSRSFRKYPKIMESVQMFFFSKNLRNFQYCLKSTKLDEKFLFVFHADLIGRLLSMSGNLTYFKEIVKKLFVVLKWYKELRNFHYWAPSKSFCM